jgi:ATP-dependent RNA circularization protein (DNA/RNA ligase family)
MSSNEFNLKYNSSYIDYSVDEAKHLEVLAKLHELRREGVITEEEYMRKRQKLIA